jgi:hypothetical protein
VVSREKTQESETGARRILEVFWKASIIKIKSSYLVKKGILDQMSTRHQERWTAKNL